MVVAQVMEIIEGLAPAALAETWDNVGLLIGDPQAEVNGCLLTLDVTTETLGEARRAGAGLVLAHHPALFGALRSVTTVDPAGALVLAAARLGVAVATAHTNLDAAPQVGTAWALCRQLGLEPGPVLERRGGGLDAIRGETEAGYGMLVTVPEMPLEALASYTQRRLGLAGMTCVGDPQVMVRRVALLPGAGGDFVATAAARADALLTGELKYHEALEAQARGLGVLLAGHWETERPVLNALARALKDACGGELQVAISQQSRAPGVYLTQ